MEGDATSQTTSKKTTHYCFEHADREPELYCETCKELICYKCVAKGGKHHDHDYDPLVEAFDKYDHVFTGANAEATQDYPHSTSTVRHMHVLERYLTRE